MNETPIMRGSHQPPADEHVRSHSEVDTEKGHVVLQWLDSMDCTFEDLYADIERSFDTCILNLVKTADEEYEAMQNDIKHIKNSINSSESESSSYNNGKKMKRECHELGSDECGDGNESVAHTFSSGSVDGDYELKAYPDAITYRSPSSLNKANVQRHSSPGRINSEPYSIANFHNDKSYSTSPLEPSRVTTLTKTYLDTISSLDKMLDESNDFVAGLLRRDKLHGRGKHQSYVDGGYVTSDELEEATDSIINAMSKVCIDNGTAIRRAFRKEEHVGVKKTLARSRRKTRRKKDEQ